jgi:choline dehydrogenase
MTAHFPDPAYDYVVVGAGSAGCVLAARLTEDPDVRVLLLEAGPADRRPELKVPATYSRLFRSVRDWAYFTEPQPQLAGRRLFWPRGRTLGGSSAINDMVYVRGNRADYDGWRDAGNRGWGYDDVLPYFRRSENQQRGSSAYHGVGGPLDVGDLRFRHPSSAAFLAAAAEVGLPAIDDFNGARQDGVGWYQVTQRRGLRASTATAFLHPARRRANLTVLTGAHATRVLLGGDRATGVEWFRSGRRERGIASREVLLCGGTINTPQLLMLSGIGAAEDLRAVGVAPVVDLPGVGGDLQDHLIAPVTYLSSQPSSLLDAARPRAAASYLLRRRGPLSSNVGQAGGFLRSQPELDAPDVQLVFAPLFLGDVADDGVVDPQLHGYTIGALLLQPASRGRITLRSADPFARPAIDPGYLQEPGDLDTLARGVAVATEIGAAPALAPWVARRYAPVDTEPATLPAHIRASAATLFHPVGTARMGSGPSAVVDDTLRVHGVEGLRVIDASVMPRIPRGNTNAATIMIAERAAALLRGETLAADPAGAASAAGMAATAATVTVGRPS